MISKPKGTYDLYGEDAIIYNYFEETVKLFMFKYNYKYLRTPIFETSELFHRSVGESSDIVTKETYDFCDRSKRNLTLRPEGTAGIVRSFIENKFYGNQNDILKYYYLGTMYRYERPQLGRNREFTQFGVEVFNGNDVMVDAEVIYLGYDFLQSLGLEDITVKLNTLGDKETREKYVDALVDYLRPNIEHLCSDCQKRIEVNPLRILDCKVDKDSDILKNVPKINDYLSPDSKEKLEKLKEYLLLLDVDFEIDQNIVRGLDYYDHFVWEYMTSDNITLGGGGRYNDLVENLGGPSIPGVGFALGVERIIIELKKIIALENLKNDIDVYIMSVNEEEKRHALMLTQSLRLNDFSVENNSNNLSFKNQFKKADLYNSKYIVILNSEDLKKGLITVKDNITKEEVKIDEKELVDYIVMNY